MMCFSPQIWASDNTDPIERLKIQGGLSYLYPQSVIGAHVSDAPHQQTLRNTPLSTRYNVACFGCLGYEMDLRFLTPTEKREVKEQIAFYKSHRKTLQYGTFERLPSPKDNKTVWLIRRGKEAILGFFQTQAGVSEGPDLLRIPSFANNTFVKYDTNDKSITDDKLITNDKSITNDKLITDDTRYSVKTRPQRLYIKRFGGLVKHLLPVTLNPEGFILRTVNRHYALTDCVETYHCSGAALAAGVMLNNQFMGSYYNDKTRLLGDYGSNLYTIHG
jgi:alpha-galactosidase